MLAVLESLKRTLGNKVRDQLTETLLYRYDAIAQGPPQKPWCWQNRQGM